MLRQIILDTETTGLSPEKGHRIIEIGCLELINRRLTDNHFHCYINPNRDIDRGAQEVHGISNEFLNDKPLFADIAEQFLEYVKDAELIIHNAPFDVGFINREFKLLKKGLSPITEYCSVIDTLTMARRKHPGQHNNLDALCRRYHVDNSNRELHGALLDAELLAQVYLIMTGGQTQLFQTEQESEIVSKANAKIKRVSKDRSPLPIIQPTEDELKAHETFIEMMTEDK